MVSKFTIRYIDKDGERYQVEKEDHHTEIDLSELAIMSLSLEPIGQCTKLEKIPRTTRTQVNPQRYKEL